MSQATLEQKEHRRKYLWIIFLLLLLIGIIVTLFFPRTANDYAQKEAKDPTGIHGTFTFTSGVGADNTGEFWFDGGKYRITWYEDDGSPRLHMISPDGRQLYHANTKDEETTVSYMPPEMHHDIFLGPSEYISTEIREENGMDVTYYDLDKLWDIEGASQQFYLKDVTRYEKDGSLKKIVAHTASRKPENDKDLTTSTYEITSWEKDVDLSSDIFELPYPVKLQ